MLKRLLVASTMLLPIAAHAAKLSFAQDKDFTFVRVIGAIEDGDDKKFENYTKNLGVDRTGSHTVIELDSVGGSVVAGVNIALHIDYMHWRTFVPSNAQCTSICAIIWLAGAEKVTGKLAYIGFHGAYSENTGHPTAMGNAVVGALLYKLGYSFDTIADLVKAPADKMEWLTTEKAQGYGIKFRVLD